MSSANAYNLNEAKILSSHEGLSLIQAVKFFVANLNFVLCFTLWTWIFVRSYHGGQWYLCNSLLSHTSTDTTLFPKPLTVFPTRIRAERWKISGREFATTEYQTWNHHFKCTLKCRLQFVIIWTSLKFCWLGQICCQLSTSSGWT